MASTPAQKPKRVPIVLNMHLLDKEQKAERDAKVAKDLKDKEDAAAAQAKAEAAAAQAKAEAAAAQAKAEAEAAAKALEEESTTVDDNNGRTADAKDDACNQDSGSGVNKAKAEEGARNGPNRPAKNGNKMGGNKDERICRDFMRNMCTRGDGCKFYHPTQNTSLADRRRNSWLTLCHDFQNGQCIRSDCRYFHITREDENLYRTTGDIHPLVVDQVMRKALYLDVFSPGVRPPCKEFLRGFCNLSTCRFRHLDRREYEDEVFRSLQDEFGIVFGPPEKTVPSPYGDNYRRDEFRSAAWYEPPPGGFENRSEYLPPGDLRTTLLGHGGYEPDLKRRRHYSDERSPYQHPDPYHDSRRHWNEAMEYDRRPPPNPESGLEVERLMQEISNLRNDKIEITRSMDQQILVLRDEMAILTRENESFRQDNAMLRNSLTDVEMSNKTAVNSLMTTNDNLVIDNRELKINLQKLEAELIDVRKMFQRKFDDIEKERNDLKKSLSNSKEAEQKTKDEVQKIRTEKEALQKIRDNLKAELERANHQLSAANKAGQNMGRSEQDKPTGMYQRPDPKEDNHRNAPNEMGAGRLGSGPRGQDKQDGPNWGNRGNQQQNDRQSRPDWQARPWGNQQQNDRSPANNWAKIPRNDQQSGGPRNNQQSGGPRNDQQSGGPRNDQQSGGPRNDQQSGGPRNDQQSGGPRNDQQSGGPRNDQQSGGPRNDQQSGGPSPWRSAAEEKTAASQASSLLGEFPQSSSLLGQYPATAGQNLIKALSQFGANKGLPGPLGDLGANKNLSGPLSDIGANKGPSPIGARPDFGANKGPLGGPRPDFEANKGRNEQNMGPPSGPPPDFGANKGLPSGPPPDFGANKGPPSGQRPDGLNQAQNGQRSDFGPTQGQNGQRPDFRSNQGPGGQRFDYGPGQGQGGQRSDYGPGQGQGGQRSDYGPGQGQGGQRSDYGQGQGGQRSDYGPGQRSDYGAGQRSDYGAGQRSDYGAGQRSDYGPGQRSDYGPGQRSDYGPGQRSDYRPNFGQSGQSGLGSDKAQSGQRSDYGSNLGQGGRSDLGSSQGQSGRWSSDFGAQKGPNEPRSDYGSNRSGQSGPWGDYGSNRGQSSQRGDMWNDRSQGQSRGGGGIWNSEKDQLNAPSYLGGSQRPRLGERDYGLSGYDNGIREGSSLASGSDARGSSLRSSWLREDEDRLAGRPRPRSFF